jgi:hypothetical protein
VAVVSGAGDAGPDGTRPVGAAGRRGGGAADEAVPWDEAGTAAAGAGSLPPPYNQVPVGCTAPGLSVIPDTVA